MVAEILLVPGGAGDDLKAGAQFVGRGLASVGIKVREQISLCTDTLKLQQAIAAGLGRSNLLVLLGGMSRSSGFVSKNVISQGLGLPLEANRECLAAIQAYCKKSGEPFEVDDLDLASLPRGAKPFPPSYGKLPGCIISSAKQHIVLLPENGQEINAMFTHYVVPSLGGAQSNSTVTRTLRTYGVREEAVRDTLSDLTAAANPMVTVLKEGNEVLVRVTAHAATGQQAAALCTPVLRTMVDRLGDAAYGLDVNSLQAAVVQKMERKSLELGIAEAGLGGTLTRLLSETEGGNEILRYTVAAEDDYTKVDKLGARQNLLKKRGGVSEYAAVAMAAGAMEKTDTGGIGVGVVANTTEDSKKCPMGLVYIAVCDEEYVYVKKLIVGDGDVSPDTVIDAAVSRALNMIRLFVDYIPDKYPGAIPLEAARKGKKAVTDSGSYDDALEDDYFSAEEDEGRSGGAVRKAILTVAILIFLGCAGYLGKMGWDSWSAARLAAELQNMYEFGDMGDVEISPDYPGGYNRNLAALWTKNPDVVAFISIPDTGVRYPIVQAADNDYYLRRDFNGNSSQHGVPFMDYRVDVARPSENMVIYGHNMKDGQIFGELENYKELEYYRQHPVIDLGTLYGEDQYKIFSVFITNAYEAQGAVFPYHDFINAQSSEDFMNFVYQVQIRSRINTMVDVQPGDKLITLSSCVYDFQDARLVVVARKLRAGETADVNTADARNNPNPLYPDVWYQIYGGSKPVGETATVVTTPTLNAAPASGPEYTRPSVSTSLPVQSLVSSRPESGTTAASSVPSASPEAERGPAGQDDTGRTQPDSEEAGQLAAQSQAALASQLEASRLESEAAASLLAASDSSRIASEAEASRLKSEAEASRVASEAEASRLASEAEASRIASEAEASRLKSEAEAEAKRSASAAEASRLASASRDVSSMIVRTARDDDDEDRIDTDSGTGTTGAGPAAGNASGNRSDHAVPGAMTVLINGSRTQTDPLDLIARIVQNEVGASFHTEAIKAQAVASYTYITFETAQGKTPSVYAASSASSKVLNAVAEVIGEMVYYNGKVAYTPYHATSAGTTTSSKDVWGGAYPYLVPVDSAIETGHSSYKASITMTADEVEDRIRSKLGLEVSGDPSEWFEVLSYADGGYNGDMAVCGSTKSAKTGSKLTGRLIRETVLNLRSAKFEVDYDSSTDKFTFTTYGYGHGVGMPQNGANLYANQGWSYIDILQHYYPGTSVY